MPRRILLVFAMIGSVSVFCWQASEGAKPKDEMLELYGLFVDAVEKVQANYVRPVSRKDLLEAAIEGMLQNLDPHSSYFNISEQKSLRRQLEGRFGGIGIQVGVDPETMRLRVISPMPGTPAYEAGILAGDQIMEIDGHPAEGMSPDKAAEVLQGRPGTDVKMSVLHEGADEPETVTLTRAFIELPSVLGDHRKPDDQWDFMLDKDKKIGYLRIASFMQNTPDELRKALDQLRDEGAKGLVIDLRDDPGGMLSAAVEISDMFLASGEIVSTKGRNTPAKKFEARDDRSFFEEIPLAVLINQYAASASEIFAAAMQDHKRAAIIGQRSYGKGSVQNIIDLDGGNSVLKLTVASYYRPSGENIHRFRDSKPADKWGVSPDPKLEVKLGPSEFVRWFRARSERDAEAAAKGHKKTAAATSDTDKSKQAAPPAGKDAHKQDAKPAAKTKSAASRQRPFVDKQLDKALEVLRGELG